jgi:Rrf2 family protein
MLKISTRTRYALRALLEMACRKDQKVFHLEELSRHQNISRKYLESIFAALRKHGLVRSRVGKNGGFYLPAGIHKISLLRIQEALEGRVTLVHCLDSHHLCEKISFCPANIIWNEVNEGLRRILASKNLKDLAAQEMIRKKCYLVVSRSTKHRENAAIN